VTGAPLPPQLRRLVEEDLAPVRPLPPPWVRALVALAWAVAALLVVLVVGGVHADAGELGVLLAWGAAAVEILAGFALIALALREAVPGAALPRAALAGVLLAAALVAAATAVLTWVRTAPPASGCSLRAGMACLATEFALGVPALVATVLLAVRALPVRPRWAGVLGGVGSGLLADGLQHLICPVADLSHVLVWHVGAIVGLGCAGWWAGWGVERWRARALERGTTWAS
jgi:hypothetical protein